MGEADTEEVAEAMAAAVEATSKVATSRVVATAAEAAAAGVRAVVVAVMEANREEAMVADKVRRALHSIHKYPANEHRRWLPTAAAWFQRLRPAGRRWMVDCLVSRHTPSPDPWNVCRSVEGLA